MKRVKKRVKEEFSTTFKLIKILFSWNKSRQNVLPTGHNRESANVKRLFYTVTHGG